MLTSEIKNWTDADGFVHLKSEPGLEQSENGLLFTAHVHLLCFMRGMQLPEFPKIL